MRFPVPTTTHGGCTQNFMGVWNQTSRTESSPDCTSLNLDRRDEQCPPLNWASTGVVGSQEARFTGARAPRQEVGGELSFPPTEGSFPAETWRLPPGSHPLFHRLCRGTAESMSHSVLPKKSQKSFPQTQNQDLPIPKSHVQEVLKEIEKQRAGREGRKYEVWSDSKGGKKNHPQSLFLPSLCASDVRHLFGDKALNVNWMH